MLTDIIVDLPVDRERMRRQVGVDGLLDGRLIYGR
jgi:hypothetical protein